MKSPLRFLTLFAVCSLLPARRADADVVCVPASAAGPSSECVVSDDASHVTFTLGAIDRVRVAAARSTELQRQVSALIAADAARIAEAAALRNEATALKTVAAENAKRADLATQAAAAEASKRADAEAWGRAKFWIGGALGVVAGVAGAVLVRSVTK